MGLEQSAIDPDKWRFQITSTGDRWRAPQDVLDEVDIDVKFGKLAVEKYL